MVYDNILQGEGCGVVSGIILKLNLLKILLYIIYNV
jgi:hypothetical protein